MQKQEKLEVALSMNAYFVTLNKEYKNENDTNKYT